MSPLLLVPIDPAPREHLGMLQRRLEDAFRIPVTFAAAPAIDPGPAYDESRNQYFSSALLTSLLRYHASHDGKMLGVTSGDLYVPVLTFVFGEAQLGGAAAVISSFRLDDTFYGLPPNPATFEERLIKEAVHELGHTFGLVHCRQFDCVMHSSTSVEEIDIKSARFCPSCSSALT